MSNQPANSTSNRSDETGRHSPANQHKSAYYRICELLSLDLRSLALFRVLLGALILFDLGDRARNLSAMYTESGALPRSFLKASGYTTTISLHTYLGHSAWAVSALFVIHGLFAFAFLLGYRTRIATIGCWLLAISLHTRNPFVLGGGDSLMRTLLIWSALLPLGARYSIDNALNTNENKSTRPLINLVTIGFFIQVLALYWFSVAAKTGERWWDGRAVHYALHMDLFALPPGIWLRQFDWLLPPLTHATIWFEVVGPLLLLVPLAFGPVRVFTVLIFISFHACLNLCMGLGIISLVLITMWTLLLPGWFWDRLAARFRPPHHADIVIYYDGDCGFCARMVRIVRDLLLLDHVTIRPADDDPRIVEEMRVENSWIVQLHTGEHLHRFDAIIALMRLSPIARFVAPILNLPPLRFAGNHLYRLVAANRSTAGRINWMFPLCNRPVRPQPITNAIAVVFTVYVLLQNLYTVDNALSRKLRSTSLTNMMNSIAKVSNVLQIDQRWYLFAPQPREWDSWFLFRAELENGEVVNALRPDLPVTLDKPALASQTFPSMRWRCYLRTILSPDNLERPRLLHEYIIRNWNQNHPPEKKIKQLEILVALEQTLDHGESEPLTDRLFPPR